MVSKELEEEIILALGEYADDHEKLFKTFTERMKLEITGKIYEKGLFSEDLIGFMAGYLAAKSEKI